MRSGGAPSRSRFSRSAGACPPRWFNNRFFTVARGPVPRDRWIARTMSRPGGLSYSCPSSRYVFRSFRTYMSIAARVVLFSRSFRSLIRKRAALAKAIKDLKDLRVLRVHACYRHSGPKGPEEHKRRFSLARAMARDRPSPYVKGRRFFIVARGPSDAIRASERVSLAIVGLRGRC